MHSLYGTKGQGDKVPPLATLHFEVELLEAEEPNMFQQMDTNNDGKIRLSIGGCDKTWFVTQSFGFNTFI